MISDCSEKRYESRTEVDQYYSVELSIPDASLIYDSVDLLHPIFSPPNIT